MTPEQRQAALRLADEFDQKKVLRTEHAWPHEAAALLRELAAEPVQEPVAWCSLTPSGKIAYFDGKPMVMPGPIGNDMHVTPLYAHQT